MQEVNFLKLPVSCEKVPGHVEGQMQVEQRIIFPSQEPQLNSTFPALHWLLNQEENLKEKQEQKETYLNTFGI